MKSALFHGTLGSVLGFSQHGSAIVPELSIEKYNNMTLFFVVFILRFIIKLRFPQSESISTTSPLYDVKL